MKEFTLVKNRTSAKPVTEIFIQKMIALDMKIPTQVKDPTSVTIVRKLSKQEATVLVMKGFTLV